MIAALVEIIIEILLEALFEGILGSAFEIGLSQLEKAPRSARLGPVFRGLIYVAVGVLAGIISYFVLPAHLFTNTFLRIAGMITSPISMGLVVCAVSWFISRKDRNEPFWSTEK